MDERKHWRAVWLCLISSLLGVAPTHGSCQEAVSLLRDRQPEKRPTLLVLGTAHFANPGRDQINIEVEDVLSRRRQSELETVIEALSTFRPTHIAVEWPQTRQNELDTRYAAFQKGAYDLTRNEADQLGLRLAKRLGLKRVFAVDWNGSPPGDFASNYDWHRFAQSHGQTARISAISDPAVAATFFPPLREQSIGAWLLQLNEQERLAASHRVYFDIALIGNQAEHPGANWVGHWYARNLRIFGNVVALTDRPQDRVLIVYGQGHAYLLKQFALESGAFRLAEFGPLWKEWQ